MKTFVKPLVSIVCTTFNHEAYIHECLDGFVMQKTDFPFEVIVHDDASTDSTVLIIREYEKKYPHLFNNIYRVENWYSQKKDIWGYLFTQKVQGKYIALCEGDDYWTDPLKLQKQINILEHHSEIGAVYSRARCYYQNPGKFKEAIGKNYISFENLLCINVIPALTVMFRRELYISYENEIRPVEKGWKMGDYPMWLWMAKNSKLYFINEIFGVYRVLKESASHSNSFEKQVEFHKSCKEIQRYFIVYAHRLELLNWLEEYYNSCLYQLCLEHNYSEIETYRNFFRYAKPTSLKTKLFKIAAQHRVCEFLLKVGLRNIFIKKLYYILNG